MIRDYFKGASLLAVAEGLLQLKGLLVLPFLTRQFGPLNYGVWSQISVFIATLAPLILLGTHAAIFRFLPGIEPDKQKRFFSAWVLFLAGLAALYALPLFFFPESLSLLIFGEAGEYAVLMPLAALWLINTHLSNAVLSWFRVINNAPLFSLTKIIQAVLNVLAVALVLIQNRGIYELIFFSLISDLILLIISIAIITKNGGWSRPDFSILKPLLQFGLPLVPVSFATWGLNYVDRYFIVHFASLEQVGIYAVAYRVANQVMPLLGQPWHIMYSNSSAELYNQNKSQTLQRLFDRAAGLLLALTIPAAVGLALLGKRVFQIVATSEFASGTPVLLFISLGYIFLVLSSFYTNGFSLIHKQYITTLVYLFAVGFAFVLNFLLVPRFSILGAAIATCLSFLTLLALSIYYSNRERLLQTNWTYVFKIFIATTGMAIVVFLADLMWIATFSNSIFELLLLACVGALTYGICLWLLGILNRSELRLALSVLKK